VSNWNLHNNRESKIKTVISIIIVLLILGLVEDAFNGFAIIRSSRSFGWVIGGLFLLSIINFILEACGEWIGSKDDVKAPLYKRALHLILLLCFYAAIGAICWFLFKRLGW
jgi:hypothetical protein